MKVLGNIDVDLDVVNKGYVDGEINKINFEESFTKKEADKYFQPKGDYLTNIPKEYVTTTDLDNKSDLKVKDTRNDDRDPLWYMQNYGSKQVFEFKYRKNVGNPPIDASASKNYTIVLTRVPWRDKSGGYPTQLSFGERIALRIGTSETTWGEWQTLATTDDISVLNKTLAQLVMDIVGKADKDHKHEITDVTGLEDKLDGKAPKDHTHSDYATMEYVSTLNDIILKTVAGLSGKSDLDHKHSISDITNLQTELNSKAGVSHTHSEYLKKGDPIQLTSAQKAELKGERGAPGTPGKDGQNGMITYIRYANNPSGDNMTSSPQSDTTHIGIYTYEGRNAPPSSVYQWTRIKGDPGESINTWTGTQAEYDRIYRKSDTTLYIITE